MRKAKETLRFNQLFPKFRRGGFYIRPFSFTVFLHSEEFSCIFS